MSRKLLSLLGSAVAAAVLAATALGGEPMDPDLGDSVLGTEGGLRYSRDADPFNQSNSGYAFPQAGCGPAFFHATGGGAELTGPHAERRLASSRPVDFDDLDSDRDDGWDVSGYGGAGGELVAYAVCARIANLRYLRLSVPDSPDGIRSAKVPCGGRRWHVVGGGIFIATSQSFVNSTRPYDGADRDRKPDDGWTGRVLDTIGGIGGMEAHAVCKRGALPAYRSSSAGGVEAGESGSPRADCPNDAHVAGGGVRINGPGNRGAAVGTFPIDRGDPGQVPDDGWRGEGLNISGLAKRVTTYAICLR